MQKEEKLELVAMISRKFSGEFISIHKEIKGESDSIRKEIKEEFITMRAGFHQEIESTGAIFKGEFDRVHTRFDEMDKTIDFKVNELREEMKHGFSSVRRGIDYLADRVQNHEKRIKIFEGEEETEPDWL